MSAPNAAPNPYRTIWLAPHRTLRQIIDGGRTQEIYPLAALAGATQELVLSFSTPPTALRLIIDLLSGALFGVLVVVLGGALVALLGQRWGGNGTWADLRAAVAWATPPYVALLALLFPLKLLSVFLPASAVGWQLPLVRTLAIAANVYALGLLIINVGEAHRLPIWKAAVVALLPALPLLLPLLFTLVLVTF